MHKGSSTTQQLHPISLQNNPKYIQIRYRFQNEESRNTVDFFRM